MSSHDPRARFLAAADQLEAWAAALPRWSPGAEPWYVFLERRYTAESAIIARLQREPHCEIELCSLRLSVRLGLGDIAVSTKEGLDGALRAWAAEARMRWSEAREKANREVDPRACRAQPACAPARLPTARPASPVGASPSS